MTANGFKAIEAISDLRYDISLLGEYFADIPKRLGSHDALDAAAWAFTCAHPATYSSTGPSRQAIEAYGTALTRLRQGLMIERGASTIDMLCALMLLDTCSEWIDQPGDASADHARYMALILPKLIASGAKDEFEQSLLVMASLSVVCSLLVQQFDSCVRQ